MKGKHDYFEKKVRDRKTSKLGNEAAVFSRGDVKMTGHGDTFLRKMSVFGRDEVCPFLEHFCQFS